MRSYNSNKLILETYKAGEQNQVLHFYIKLIGG